MLMEEKNRGKMTSLSRRINKFGNIEYRNKNNKLHRDNGPAIIFADGTQSWYKNGKCHRENGPALIGFIGIQEWYKNGELHRKDGPSVIYADGRKEHWENGKIIRYKYY